MSARKITLLVLLLTCISFITAADDNGKTVRARDLGLTFGVLETGKENAITDVEGVLVGHFTLKKGKNLNTGITAILPHGGNLFREKVPGAVVVGNGFGKLAGSTQVNELGEIETPVLLTGTLNVPKVADGLITFLLEQQGMEEVYSINPLVGETNDGYLSDIRQRPLGYEEVKAAIISAKGGAVEMGSVGAGTGTICFGFKGGIGSASRVLPGIRGGWTVGVLVQTNFGGDLTMAGKNFRREIAHSGEISSSADGSLMVVIATDAPLSHRNLRRLAQRSFLGMARAGGYASNGSGDYAIAFSTDPKLRINSDEHARQVLQRPDLDNKAMSPLFQAVAEATHEAIIESMVASRTVEGYRGTIPGLPLEQIEKIIK